MSTRTRLKNPNSTWRYASVTHVNYPESYSLSTEDWRYIHYRNGDEELYDTKADRYEWHNLAGNPQYAPTLKKLRAKAPKEFAPYVRPKDSALPELTFHHITTESAPVSKPDGNPFDIIFSNGYEVTVKLFRVGTGGELEPHDTIAPGEKVRQKARPGDVWLAAGPSGQSLGYFVVEDRSARAIILPESETNNKK